MASVCAGRPTARPSSTRAGARARSGSETIFIIDVSRTGGAGRSPSSSSSKTCTWSLRRPRSPPTGRRPTPPPSPASVGSGDVGPADGSGDRWGTHTRATERGIGGYSIDGTLLYLSGLQPNFLGPWSSGSSTKAGPGSWSRPRRSHGRGGRPTGHGSPTSREATSTSWTWRPAGRSG